MLLEGKTLLCLESGGRNGPLSARQQVCLALPAASPLPRSVPGQGKGLEGWVSITMTKIHSRAILKRNKPKDEIQSAGRGWKQDLKPLQGNPKVAMPSLRPPVSFGFLGFLAACTPPC